MKKKNKKFKYKPKDEKKLRAWYYKKESDDKIKFKDFGEFNDKWTAYLLAKPPASMKDLINRVKF